MSTTSKSSPAGVDLRDRSLAALLAWLLPGAGHYYQGRTAKAALFFICILGTFAYGMFLGGGRVVYAQWSSESKYQRWSYFCQLGVGLPALPAIVAAQQGNFLGTKYYVAPAGIQEDPNSELSQIHKKYNRRFELGTAFTMIAGLLNVLAVYDAWAGPAYGNLPPPEEARRRKKRKEDKEDEADESAEEGNAPSAAGESKNNETSAAG